MICSRPSVIARRSPADVITERPTSSRVSLDVVEGNVVVVPGGIINFIVQD